MFYSCPHSCPSADAGDSHGTPMPDGIQSNYNLKKKACYDFALRGKEVCEGNLIKYLYAVL